MIPVPAEPSNHLLITGIFTDYISLCYYVVPYIIELHCSWSVLVLFSLCKFLCMKFIKVYTLNYSINYK